MITDYNYHKTLGEIDRLVLLEAEGKISPDELEQLNGLTSAVCKYERDLLAEAFEPYED